MPDDPFEGGESSSNAGAGYNPGVWWSNANAAGRGTVNQAHDLAGAPRRWVAKVGDDLEKGGTRAILFGLAVGVVLYLAWR